MIAVLDLHVFVEVDPAAAARTLDAEDLLRHEVVGGLDTHAEVGLVSTVRETDLLPESRVVRLVLNTVVPVDTDLLQVPVAVVKNMLSKS